MSQIKILVGGDVFCPCCGTAEVEDTSLPVLQWKWNIRPNKVETDGVWWSECLLCKIWFGDDGHFEVTDATNPTIRESLGLTQNGYYRVTYEGAQ